MATLRLEVLPDPNHEGRTNVLHDPFSLTFELYLVRPGEKERLVLVMSDAYPDQRTAGYFNGQILTSVILGWRSVPGLEKVAQSATYVLQTPVMLKEGDRLEMGILS
jgi:hypothetical protein